MFLLKGEWKSKSVLIKMKSRIQRLAIKLLPQIRQKEKDRRSHSQDDTDKKSDTK